MKKLKLGHLLNESKINDKIFKELVGALETMYSIHLEIEESGDSKDITRYNKILKNYNMSHLMIL